MPAPAPGMAMLLAMAEVAAAAGEAAPWKRPGACAWPRIVGIAAVMTARTEKLFESAMSGDDEGAEADEKPEGRGDGGVSERRPRGPRDPRSELHSQKAHPWSARGCVGPGPADRLVVRDVRDGEQKAEPSEVRHAGQQRHAGEHPVYARPIERGSWRRRRRRRQENSACDPCGGSHGVKIEREESECER